MPQYFDSGADPRFCLGEWLDRNLEDGSSGIWAQFGYFRASALASFATRIRSMAVANRPLHFVVGSNDADLTADDLRGLIALLEDGNSWSITVVAYRKSESERTGLASR